MLRYTVAMHRFAAARAVVLLVFATLAEVPGKAEANCTCVAHGRRLELGERICLNSAEGPRMAICIKQQNLTYWKFSNQGCAVSSLSRPPRS
jgi:hypothetical protein